MAYLEENFDSILIRISAHDAIDQGLVPQSTSSFQVNLSATAQRIFDGVRAIQFCNATIPNTFYNVPAGRNWTQYTDSVSGLNTFELAPGQYSINSIMDHLKTILSASTGQTVTVNIDDVTKKVKITITGGAEVTFPQANFANMNPLGHILGMSEIIPGDLTSVGGVLEFPDLPRTQGVTDVIINCSQIAIRPTPDIGGVASAEHYVARIPMNVPFGAVAHYDVSESVSHIFDYNRTTQSIGTLDIYLTDDRDMPLDLNGADWSFTLKVFTI